ncbi:unnamed protein product [Auanema sp. JU1783]|nr:unnamed protein product [Auanema sp. JU1783]
MLKRFGASSSSLWKPKNPHSLEYLKYLHGVLVKNEKVTDSNRKILVEALRAIAEILIWGDQNDGSVFDFFLERQMLSHFLEIMKQESGSLNVQLLQTLNILFENIRHETSLYFLLSNNHVNYIITYNFDLSNEEIMAYYISFLKTLSFKLNPCTIHFFFTESTNEFALLTETLKLFDSSEGMVRIAVRNIFLNIARVNDPAMLTFLQSTTKSYLCQLIDTIVRDTIDLDIFVRSAENVAVNRDRLRDKVDDLVDLLHYISELLDVDALAESLSDLLSSRFLFPLLLNSLASRRHNSSMLLTSVSSLFLFSQVLLIISHKGTINRFLKAFLFDDCSVLNNHWVRQESTYTLLCLDSIDPPSGVRVFFESLLSSFDMPKCDDYLVFYALMVVYSMFQNKECKFKRCVRMCFSSILACLSLGNRQISISGDAGDILTAAHIPSLIIKRRNTEGVEYGEEALPPENDQNNTITCDERILSALLSVIEAAGNDDIRLRPVVLELSCLVLRQLIMVTDADQIQTRLCQVTKNTSYSLVEQLGAYVNAENLFLEWFEDEYAEFERSRLNLEVVSAELLLPPCSTALSGLPLPKRLPSGFEERIRSLIQLYLHVRKLEKDLHGESDSELPISLCKDEAVALGDCINLNNSDLLACVLVIEKEKSHRFLVTDRLQFILVEPDTKKAGWAVVRFVGLLQDTQINGDPTESRALHIVIEGQPPRNRKRQCLLNGKLLFDDHIRCMAAKQRLTRGRQTARGLKLQAICDMLGVPRPENSSPRTNPFRIIKGCPPGSVRKQNSASFPGLHSNSHSSLNSIPDDPQPGNNGVHLV